MNIEDSVNELDLKNNNIIDLLDNTFLNLKMLSEINEHDKLYIEDKLLKIDSPYMLQGIMRWYHEYSRNKTLDYLDTIIKNINYIYDIISQKKTKNYNKEYENILQNLLLNINLAIKGLTNLKITYKNDVYTKSKLDMIIGKFKTTLDRINNSINIIDIIDVRKT